MLGQVQLVHGLLEVFLSLVRHVHVLIDQFGFEGLLGLVLPPLMIDQSVEKIAVAAGSLACALSLSRPRLLSGMGLDCCSMAPTAGTAVLAVLPELVFAELVFPEFAFPVFPVLAVLAVLPVFPVLPVLAGWMLAMFGDGMAAVEMRHGWGLGLGMLVRSKQMSDETVGAGMMDSCSRTLAHRSAMDVPSTYII